MLACLLPPALSETRLDAALRVARSRVHASSIHSTSGGAVSPLSNASGRLRPADQMEGNTGDVKGQSIANHYSSESARFPCRVISGIAG